jgi:hypothetical protein
MRPQLVLGRGVVDEVEDLLDLVAGKIHRTSLPKAADSNRLSKQSWDARDDNTTCDLKPHP